jgi:hypothetical protein
MFQITFQFATVSQCNYIGLTVTGIAAVVLRDGVEVFRSKPSTKRFMPRQEAEAWIKQAAA